MSTTILHYIELIAGCVALLLTIISWRPMQRYYKVHSTIARNDEMLVVGWLVVFVFGVTMVIYGLL